MPAFSLPKWLCRHLNNLILKQCTRNDYYSLDPPVSQALADHESPLLIKPSSSREFKEYVEFFARCFKREFDTDFIGYEASEDKYKGYIPYEAYLFHEDAPDKYDLNGKDEEVRRYVGACCFRFIENKRVLSWVWFHPYKRRRKYLSQAWHKFREKYGNFDIEQPLSLAMEKFIENCEKPND